MSSKTSKISAPSSGDPSGCRSRTRASEFSGSVPAELIFRGAGRDLRRAGLLEFARRLQREVAGGASFCCLISNDRELLRLNREFLGKDYPADVLSFPESGARGEIGELAISAERAREQAARRGHSWQDEIRILMLHGVLHLVGLDHETDRGRMARVEKQWRARLGLPPGLIERARQRC
jgi:probable rRNA maturation factor